MPIYCKKDAAGDIYQLSTKPGDGFEYMPPDLRVMRRFNDEMQRRRIMPIGTLKGIVGDRMMADILAACDTNPTMRSWVDRVFRDGYINLDNPDTTAGLSYFVANMPGFTQETADVILAAGV